MKITSIQAKDIRSTHLIADYNDESIFHKVLCVARRTKDVTVYFTNESSRTYDAKEYVTVHEIGE